MKCHGSSKAFLLPGKAGLRVGIKDSATTISVKTFANELAPRLVNGAIIGIAACLTASSPGETGNGPDMYGPGGEKSFAALLRDALAENPNSPQGVQIRAHSTVGDTTKNPAARSFAVASSEVGKPGLSVLDQTWGVGAHSSRTIDWIKVFKGENAEEWITGGEVRVS